MTKPTIIVERVLETLLQVQQVFAQMEDAGMLQDAPTGVAQRIAEVRGNVLERIIETRRFAPRKPEGDNS